MGRGSTDRRLGRRLFGLGFLALVVGLAAAFSTGGARADPVQNVWVHYDYMAGDGVSFAPDPAGIQMVVDAFKRHGVILHIDPQHTAIPLRQVIVFDAPTPAPPPCPENGVNFSAVKAQYFHPNSNHPWHYAIFAKYLAAGNCTSDTLHAGVSVINGHDFVVALGSNFDNGSNPSCDYFDFQTGGNLPCWPTPDYAWAMIFMHELGHNLGLRHGGDGDTNYKPNYVSVMNYADSASEPIVTSSTTTASGYWYRIDYSDETLPLLDEHNLDETAGIGPTLHPTDYILWCCQFSGFAPASGPLDWNGNGEAMDTGVSGDINFDGQLTILKGFNDWAEVHQYLADEDTHPRNPGPAVP